MANQLNPSVSDLQLPEELHQYLQNPSIEAYHLRCPGLPLAVYREVEAHLRQVQGAEVGLLPQTSQTFEYGDSQVGGIWIRYTRLLTEVDIPQLASILAHYAACHRPWEIVAS